MKPLTDLLQDIRRGAEIDPNDLLPHLCVERKADRYAVTAALAEAYLKSGRVDRAKVFAERAWLLSEFSEDLLPLYVEVQQASNDIAAIRDAYERVGMKFAAAGNILQTIYYFNLSHYAFQRAGRGDIYEYDFDVLGKIDEMASPYRFSRHAPLVRGQGEKVRVAYLVFGATHSESVLIKLLRSFARFHDRTRFESVFFVPDRVMPLLSPGSFEYNERRQNNIQKLESVGARIVATKSTDELEALFDTATRIYEFRPHILVTTAVLADFGHYFIRAMQPAPVTLGLSFGPPQQYAAPDLDWVISGAKHPLIDSPCTGSIVEIEIELPDPVAAVGYNRADFGIPDGAVVVLCAGRPEKFLSEKFWSALIDMLLGNLGTYLVVVGLSEEPRFLAELMPANVRNRFVRLGWRSDYLRILGMADILVDTFPSGGGVTLLDAMALGKPVVSFRNNYMETFDQANWSVAEEFVEPSELVVERGNFDQFNAMVSRLIEEPSYRAAMGHQCRETVARNRGNPERMIRRHEQIYERVIAMASGGAVELSPMPAVPIPRAPAAPRKLGVYSVVLGLARQATRSLYLRLSRIWRAE